MELEKGLHQFLQEATTENVACTVEGSFGRMLTEEEFRYINQVLHPFGCKVACFQCNTCAEYSNGEQPFHLERTILR